ncbi:phage tail family protein [Clostridium sp. 19966]|uniref:distal tail protein Dit n=1 Tax=Clostridium sp. 19966 TaxID=2768166 RepID=UPI0028DF0C4E|nr:distal tail protein Dit [Clostridium sp. 19966]MDT8717826.1 phage tail family protein [Clostridium sp. 19966]
MPYWCYIDGASSKELGLLIPSRAAIPFSKKDMEYIDIEGRDGSLTRDKHRRLDKVISVSFTVVDFNNMPQSARTINRWLEGKELKFSDDMDVFYKVKNYEADDLERSYKAVGSFKVKFTVDPFNWMEDGRKQVEVSKPGNIFNLANYKSQPVIQVYGDGDITLTINGNAIELSGVEDNITIDTAAKLAYKDSTHQNSKMSGIFPEFQEGSNNIQWTGNVTKLMITPNWRDI